MPLSVLRGQRRPGRKWTALDRLLTLALQEYEDDLCPNCGTPRTYGMDPDAAGLYHSHETTCHACAELEHADKRQQKPRPGVRRYVAPGKYMADAMRRPLHVNPPPPMRLTSLVED